MAWQSGTAALANFTTVSWNWGGGAPGGKVVDKKEEGEIAIKSKRGNTIKKNASPDNPAVHVGRSGNDVVKRASELTVEEKASGGAEKSEKGDKKREAEDDGEEAAKEEGKETKKARGAPKKAAKKDDKKGGKKDEKKDDKKEEANGEKKKPGRPKKGDGETAAKKKKDPTPRSADGIGSRTRSRQ